MTIFVTSLKYAETCFLTLNALATYQLSALPVFLIINKNRIFHLTKTIPRRKVICLINFSNDSIFFQFLEEQLKDRINFLKKTEKFYPKAEWNWIQWRFLIPGIENIVTSNYI